MHYIINLKIIIFIIKINTIHYRKRDTWKSVNDEDELQFIILIGYECER